MKKVVVAGAGAAGMMAAGVAAQRGCKVILVEKNAKPGRKLMITGKGRCNVTNSCDIDEFMSNVPVNSKFLYRSLAKFSPQQTIDFFENRGVKLKTERGKRVFPESDHASDIVDALRKFVLDNGVTIVHDKISDLSLLSGEGTSQVQSVVLESGRKVEADAVILCTGGKSYPLTGSTGDGYEIAEHAGHHIVPLKPSLVPIVTSENWPADLQGLSLRNVHLSAREIKSKRTVFEETGEMIFTHFGVSGPLVLSASSHIRDIEKKNFELSIDLKPGLTQQQLDLRIQRDFLQYANRDFANSLNELLPRKMIPVIVKLSEISPQMKTNQITKDMRGRLVELLKDLRLTVQSFRPIEEAIVTSGGVDVKQVDPGTMQSKLVKGLYFAGEILDVDAHTGGFNLQIAFSTGFTAGMSV